MQFMGRANREGEVRGDYKEKKKEKGGEIRKIKEKMNKRHLLNFLFFFLKNTSTFSFILFVFFIYFFFVFLFRSNIFFNVQITLTSL